MNIKIISNGNLKHEQLLKKYLEKRISVDYNENGLTIELLIDDKLMKEESYIITKGESSVSVIAQDEAGLYFGIGKLLHSAVWEKDSFSPLITDGVQTPNSPFRAIYCATHLNNYYEMAPTEEQKNYIEELMLWGYNTVVFIIPNLTIKSFEDPQFKIMTDHVCKLLKFAKKVSMKTGFILGPNWGMADAPHEFDNVPDFDLTFRGNHGRNLCISKPDAVEYMKTIWTGFITPFKEVGLDYIISWPYDEGGCGCEKCRPWGANMFLTGTTMMRDEVIKLYPDVKFIVSTWAFDAPNDDGEYKGLYERLKTDMSWVDMIMVDAHGDYPKYPLEHDVIKPIVSFPEISMWGLYPWGGFGANPLPKRFQRIWDSAKRILKGGMPYSEGIYEDMSKIQCVGYFWNPDASYQSILKEYINYEYSSKVCDEALKMIEYIEENHVRIEANEAPISELAEKAKAIAEKINSGLDERAKNSWRWRILFIRAILDEKRYREFLSCERTVEELGKMKEYSADYLLEDSEAQNYFKELRNIYHCVEFNNKNAWTLPPFGGTKFSEY